MSGPGNFGTSQRSSSRRTRHTIPTARVVQLRSVIPSDLDDLAGWSLSVHAQAEQLAELTNNQDRRDTVEVPDEHGS